MRKCVVDKCGNRASGRFLRCHPCQNSMLRYGLTSIDRQSLLDEQDGKCLICCSPIFFEGKRGPSGNGAVVDHCHKSKKVRGIVCSKCNTLLGVIESKNIDINRIRDYLI